jgi:DNA-binding MarR family transcriptional regulator
LETQFDATATEFEKPIKIKYNICVSEESSQVNTQIDGCLVTWGISFLEEWDLLVFLHRHRNSLLTVEQISLLLGYGTSAMSQALRTLETAGLVRRSRSSQGIRFSRLVASVDADREDCFELLLSLLKKPLARDLVARRLARAPAAVRRLRRSGLYLT